MSTAQTVTLSSGSVSEEEARVVSVPAQLGPVRLIRELGRGGMGVVWLGHDDILARDVAVKFLLHATTTVDDPHGVQFIAGARVAAQVQHPSLVSVHHAELVQTLPFIVMDFVDGPTLRDVLTTIGALPTAAAVAIILRVVSGVAALHEANIVHRDIKPANVLLDADGGPRVCDFGLACVQRSTVSQSMSGTPVYMAPEMFEGIVTPRTDVYALGILAYTLLTGDAPFHGNIAELHEAHRMTPLPIEPLHAAKAPADVIDWVQRATHKSAMYRHKSAAALLRAVQSDSAALCTPKRVAAELAALMVRFHAGLQAQQVTSADQVDPMSGQTYFDRIAKMAQRKRG